MKVLLISANAERISALPLPLGLACVAAACRRAGHEVVLLDLMFAGEAQPAVRNCIEAFRPDIIGVSVRNIDDQSMVNTKFLLPAARDVVTACRSASDAPVVLGGAGFSIFPESVLRYLGADMGIHGEGETIFPALLERLKAGADVYGLPDLYLPGRPAPERTFALNLDDLPLPDPDLFIPAIASAKDDLWIPVETKRGCPMRCSFCSTKDIQGTVNRRRSPAAIVNWLENVASRGFRNFVVIDNTFSVPPSHAKEVCREIIHRGLDLNLWCIVYPKWVDRELVDLMARAGCREVSLGFESGSDRILASFNKRFKAEEVATVSRMFADAGIRRMGFLMLGGPGETRETVEESLSFAASLKLDGLKAIAGIRIYPNTALAATALAEGIIGPETDLLSPTFYITESLREWLPERIAGYAA